MAIKNYILVGDFKIEIIGCLDEKVIVVIVVIVVLVVIVVIVIVVIVVIVVLV